MSWRPILSGDDAAAARATIDAILQALDGADLGEPSIAGGNAGLALLHGQLALAADDDATVEREAERAVASLERALEGLDRESQPWLLPGTTGVVWTMQYLSDLIEVDEEAAQPVDGLIGIAVGETPWKYEWELMSGIIGFGIYALARGEAGAETAAQIVRQLDALAERERDGVRLTWRSPPSLLTSDERARNPTYHNLGLAHGVAGAVAFLAEATAAGVPGAAPLLEGATRWLIAHDTGSPASRFPRWLGHALRAGGQLDGWCYGDQAIAAALVRAGQVTGEDAWTERGRDVARAVARREPNVPLDAAFCHGTAGRAHMFNRLGQALGDDELLAAARRWTLETIRMRQPDRGVGVAGYVASNPIPAGTPADGSVLNGAAGIALVLSAAVDPAPPDWDRAFLVALPPGERD